MRMAFLGLLMTMLILGQGCSVLDGDDPEDIALAKVSVAFDTLITRDMYHISLAQGILAWHYGPEDFSNPRWTPSEVQLSGHGTLVLDFKICASDGGVISAGSVRKSLQPDIRYFFTFKRDNQRRPTHAPTDWKSYPIADARYKESEQDSIFLIMGSNFILDPVQY